MFKFTLFIQPTLTTTIDLEISKSDKRRDVGGRGWLVGRRTHVHVAYVLPETELSKHLKMRLSLETRSSSHDQR